MDAANTKLVDRPMMESEWKKLVKLKGKIGGVADLEVKAGIEQVNILPPILYPLFLFLFLVGNEMGVWANEGNRSRVARNLMSRNTGPARNSRLCLIIVLI